MRHPRFPDKMHEIAHGIHERPRVQRLSELLYPYRKLFFWLSIVAVLTVISANIQEYPIYNKVSLLLIAASSLSAIIAMLIGTTDWTTRGVGIFFNKWGATILFGSAYLALVGVGDGIGRYERAALRSFYIVGSTLFLFGFCQFINETFTAGRWYIHRKKAER